MKSCPAAGALAEIKLRGSAQVMGDVAGRPSAEQLDAMKVYVDQAMRAGAVGIATALIYPPGSFQSNAVIDAGRHTGAKPGQVLRGAGYESSTVRPST